MMTNGLFKLPKPDSKEMDEVLDAMCESYANCKPSIVQNERIRPAGQDFLNGSTPRQAHKGLATPLKAGNFGKLFAISKGI